MSTDKNGGLLRTFVAIELPSNVRQLLGRHIEGLRRVLPASVRWVQPRSVHLTLKFLGNTRKDQVPEITAALRAATGEVAPFQLKTGGLGGFPNIRRPRVLWLGLEGDIELLADLQMRVEEAISPLGFERENRPFSAHLTLARARSGGVEVGIGEKRLEELLSGWPRNGGESFTVEGVSLMQSTLTPQGAVYARLALVELGRKLPKGTSTLP